MLRRIAILRFYSRRLTAGSLTRSRLDHFQTYQEARSNVTLHAPCAFLIIVALHITFSGAFNLSVIIVCSVYFSGSSMVILYLPSSIRPLRLSLPYAATTRFR